MCDKNDLTLREAYKIIDAHLGNNNSIKQVLANLAVSNMFVSKDYLMELIAAEKKEKNLEQLLQEVIDKYKKTAECSSKYSD